MRTLAVVMLINSSRMNNSRSSLIIFAAALVLLAHRKILPRQGIVIGTVALGGAKRGK